MDNYPHQNPYPYPYQPPPPAYGLPPPPIADPYNQPPPPPTYQYPYNYPQPYPPPASAVVSPLYSPSAPPPPPPQASHSHSGPFDYHHRQQYPPPPHSVPLSGPLDYHYRPPTQTNSGPIPYPYSRPTSPPVVSVSTSPEPPLQKHGSFQYDPSHYYYSQPPESSQELQSGVSGLANHHSHDSMSSIGIGSSPNVEDNNPSYPSLYPPVDDLLRNTHLSDNYNNKNSFNHSSGPASPSAPSVPPLPSVLNHQGSNLSSHAVLTHQGSNLSSHALLTHQGSNLSIHGGHYRYASDSSLPSWEGASGHPGFSHSSSFNDPEHSLNMQIVPVQKGSLKVLLLHGNLDVWVYSAKNLPNMDMFHRTLGDVFGRFAENVGNKIEGPMGSKITSDPYVTISVAGAVVGRTFVISNSENPVWQQHFYVPVAHNAAEVHFLVKDSDVVGSELIGVVSIPVEQIYSGAKVEGTFPVLNNGRKQCKPGAVLSISIQYTPMMNLSVYHQGVGAGPDYIGVPGTYFPLRKGGSVTLYQDAHVPNGSLPNLMLDRGIPYVHGKCWFDIFDAIRQARRLIYITGWSVWHKVRLVRDAGPALDCTLGELLRSKSQEGVRVLLLIWDDPTSRSILGYKTDGVMATHDEETRRFFKHSSVQVLLCPRTAGKRHSWIKQKEVGTIYTHHQKSVIVDANAGNNYRKIIAFVGGLDLCDGRYDTPDHSVFRTLETVHKDDYHNPTYTGSTAGCPREPWHDLHSKIDGPAAYDVLTNFEERWLKASKPQGIKKLKKSYDDALLRIDRISDIVSASDAPSFSDNDPESWHVQIFRSIDSNSVRGFPKDPKEATSKNLMCGKNVLIDMSIHTAYVKAIRSAQHYIYIENQYFIGSSYNWGSYKDLGANNLIPMEIALKIAEKIRANERFAAYIVIPMWPEGVPTGAATQRILFWQKQTMQMMYETIYKALVEVGLEDAFSPQDYLNFFCLGIGELFLSAFLQVLFERLMSPDLLQFARREGLHPTLKKWERKLKTIESVLNDAEEKQLTDNDVKMWLDDLRDLAYDVEDILDEFVTEALRRKLIIPTHDDDHQCASSSTSKVRGVFTACCFNTSNWSPTAMKFNISMNSKIKAITSRMEELCNQKADFGLKEIGGKALNTSSAAAAAVRPPTTCLPTEFAVYGRDEEKAEVLKMVLCDEGPSDANFGVVPIVGMGGLGKTTLAREVYKDKEVKDFEPKAWVCVSIDFDVLGISKAILESITSKSCDLKDLNQVQLQLKDALFGRKFLLVLDDVWSKNYNLWESLRSPFMVGAQGSKVIVTTRSKEVALTMGPRPVGYYMLKLLSDDDCWSVFQNHAFQSGDINKHRNSELIRDKVVKKCRGLPLAARTLGGLLCSKEGDDEWEDVLNSAIWDLSDENGILPVLKLSYYHLPSHLKRCFAYCAILPKDYVFNKEDLVLLWMAEGLVLKRKDNKQLEDLGNGYFNELLSRSIFQQSDNNESTYVMHDLVNDLAQWVSGETSLRLEEEDEENKQSKMFERARHFSFISAHYNDKAKFEVLHKVERLRTFLAIPPSIIYYDFCMSIAVVSDLFSKFKKLRALSLKRYHIVELPDTIGGLIHLRYLNLSHTMIRTLPESVSSLFNLQTLILSNCSCLVELPSKMENMSNLQHLDIRGTRLIREMPLGIKELKDLQILTNFTVGKDGAGCALEDLKNFKFLQGDLCISRLDNVVGVDQVTGEAILSNKKGLKVLELEWGSEFDASRNEVEEETVVESLKPHTNLRSLTLKCYGGIRFPSWLGDASYSNMTVLRLERCQNCTTLPSLGLLSLLKDLTIVGMKRLKSLASEFCGSGCLRSFQSLEILRFEDLQEWDSWETTEKNEHFETFPRLRELSIKKCPKLSGKLPDHLPLLEKLAISECAQLVASLSSLPALCKLEVNGCTRVVWCCPSDSQSMQGFQRVESLEIVGCEELLRLWQNEISLEKTPKAFNSLKNLCIQDCQNLVSFPEICFLPLLTELKIKNCYALMSLPEGVEQKNVRLKRLEIDGNDSLSFVTRGQLPSSLKELRLNKCEKLQYVFGDADETHTSSYSVVHEENINIFLERLTVISCPSLTCLSTRDQLPATLRYLHIGYCSKITTLSRGQLPDSLQDLNIWNCRKVESITERFHNSMLLETIVISVCANFQSIPEGIHKLSRLREICIHGCPSLVCFPEEGLPNTNLKEFIIIGCKNLKALRRGMQTLNSLCIRGCPSIKSFPEECFHTKLTALEIGIRNLDMYEQLIQWVLPKLTSLTSLGIGECPDVESFEIGMMLPTSLTHLTISQFPKLKYLSSYGFQNLTSLVSLSIQKCPNLISFPTIGMPSSLMQLYIYDCPMLQKQCRKNKGQEWSKIAHIPCVLIDYKELIDDLEEEE